MSAWRVIVTDSESLSGIAPICLATTEPGGLHDLDRNEPDPTARFDEHGVYDCCPGPHIELWSTDAAELMVEILTEADAELCS